MILSYLCTDFAFEDGKDFCHFGCDFIVGKRAFERRECKAHRNALLALTDLLALVGVEYLCVGEIFDFRTENRVRHITRKNAIVDYDGKVAVGAVVINRVLSGSFPDTVVGVIYQNKQFSPVGSGRLELALSTNRATPECYRAADEAMSGVSNVGNCLFFRTPVPGLEGISIGGHVFY